MVHPIEYRQFQLVISTMEQFFTACVWTINVEYIKKIEIILDQNCMHTSCLVGNISFCRSRLICYVKLTSQHTYIILSGIESST